MVGLSASGSGLRAQGSGLRDVSSGRQAEGSHYLRGFARACCKASSWLARDRYFALSRSPSLVARNPSRALSATKYHASAVEPAAMLIKLQYSEVDRRAE